MNDCRKNSSHHAPRDEARKRDRFPKADVYDMVKPLVASCFITGSEMATL